MPKCTTAQRLKEIMRERNLRQADLLQMAQPYCQRYSVKLGKSDLSQFISGRVTPGRAKLMILGLALDVSEPWLMGLDVCRERDGEVMNMADAFRPMPATITRPRLGTIACGDPILAEQNIEGYDQVPDYIKCDFTLVCRGDSMTGARIYDGDIVCIKQQPTVENGQIAAVLIGDEATLKRVRFEEDGSITLWPENTAYSPRNFAGAAMEQVKILGVATHFISRVV